ncbi:hypothetical protein QM996_02390 [Sinorhizobium chiapasense]
MEKEITDKIKKKFLEYRNYRRNRLAEPWELSQDDWVEFFTVSDERAVIVIKPRGVSRLYRLDEALPWSLDNLGIAEKEIRKDSKHQFGIVREADGTLTKAFDRFDVSDVKTDARTLTRKQWIAELLETASDK